MHKAIVFPSAAFVILGGDDDLVKPGAKKT
jgi:hypothetical protein